ncbi:TetR/AcrR family transcriptional regulator [Plebeiibacterium sediminum]|uniref:TetR/AcrR family transcriptional regulator n=1 Tax=Plebeiibacterium sediminum TaxID=2992112 RepID=A0AAE3SFP5_9BACT|nr:TetR/AcrR family transcriptional regulator [Plebeiobacterium sediminum]MCW3786393.1 TetR/AcrR family transcriptional regulator [Plebeiobacterium sediminum]
MAKVGDLELETRLFETTKEMLVKYGVRGWNMDELSKECGVSKRTLYKIIGNKEDLLYKVIEVNFLSEIEKRREYLNGVDDYVSKLDSFGSFFANNFEDFVLLNARDITKEYPRIEDMIKTRKQNLNNILTDFFKQGQKLGLIDKSIKPSFISNFIDVIITANINSGQSSAEFREKLKPELEIIIRGIRIS